MSRITYVILLMIIIHSADAMDDYETDSLPSLLNEGDADSQDELTTLIHPTINPSLSPTRQPTRQPTTFSPTKSPTNRPTRSPTFNPTTLPTDSPTEQWDHAPNLNRKQKSTSARRRRRIQTCGC